MLVYKWSLVGRERDWKGNLSYAQVLTRKHQNMLSFLDPVRHVHIHLAFTDNRCWHVCFPCHCQNNAAAGGCTFTKHMHVFFRMKTPNPDNLKPISGATS
jgi:hypothetical protein